MRKQNVMNNAGLPVLEIGEQVIKDKILDNTDDPWCETFVLLVSSEYKIKFIRNITACPTIIEPTGLGA